MKVWVRYHGELDRYSGRSEDMWLLGTIVGQRKVQRFKDRPAMLDQIKGDTSWEETRYLVDTEKGPLEAWGSDTYTAIPKEEPEFLNRTAETDEK